MLSSKADDTVRVVHSPQGSTTDYGLARTEQNDQEECSSIKARTLEDLKLSLHRNT